MAASTSQMGEERGNGSGKGGGGVVPRPESDSENGEGGRVGGGRGSNK